MKKVSFVIERQYQNNIIFNKKQTKITIRDDAFAKYYKLHDIFIENGYQVFTNDLLLPSEADAIIYNDLPKKLPLKHHIHKSYLITNESPLIRPDNFTLSSHHYFRKIFTWNDLLLDKKKYFKLNYSFNIKSDIPIKFNNKKLCCLIAGNKTSKHPNELYSERRKAIEWFEQNKPFDFDLYGTGWNEYKFHGIKPVRILNRSQLAKKAMFRLFGHYYTSYKGSVVSKFSTLQKYKFAICYENITGFSGYITEKIFDAFFAGCIPIYLGANNVTDHIPHNCFIDKRNFSTYSDLYKFIYNMRKEEYMKYLYNIKTFLQSERAYLFSNEYFAKTLLLEITR